MTNLNIVIYNCYNTGANQYHVVIAQSTSDRFQEDLSERKISCKTINVKLLVRHLPNRRHVLINYHNN